MLYSLVNAAGQIVRSRYTDNMNAYAPPGHRLLPDTPPTPNEYQGLTRVEPVPEYATAIQYVIAYLSLPVVKAVKANAITQARNAEIAAGVIYGGHTYAADPTSALNLTATVSAIQAGIPLPADYGWRDEANVKVPMTPAQLVELAAVMLAHVNACYNNSWVKKDAAEAATTVEEVIAIQW